MTKAKYPGHPVIQNVVSWADKRRDIRAVLWTSSLAKSYADPLAELHDSVDKFSDYDIILVANSIRPYFTSRCWLNDFGPVLVVYRDPIRAERGGKRFCYVTQYENGLKIDFNLWTPRVIKGIIESGGLPDELDVGYTILLDKDDLTLGIKSPSYRAFIPKKPSEEEFRNSIELFFHEATYAAKYLWRDELVPAKNILDGDMKIHHLREMFEWRIELDHDWSLKPGQYGRYLKQRLSPEVWAELEATYVGSDIEENWQALFKMVELFHYVAEEVGRGLGYTYPYDLERRAKAYLQSVRDTPPEIK